MYMLLYRLTGSCMAKSLVKAGHDVVLFDGECLHRWLNTACSSSETRRIFLFFEGAPCAPMLTPKPVRRV